MIDSGTVNFENKASQIYARLDMKTLNTQNSYRDGHLRDKADFFDVAKYPKGLFVSDSIVAVNDNGNYAYAAYGKLTLKEATKPVVIMFNYSGASEVDGDGKKIRVAGFEGETTINKADFNINSSSAADDVKITLSIEVNQEITAQ